jgi:hypothetical protein
MAEKGGPWLLSRAIDLMVAVVGVGFGKSVLFFSGGTSLSYRYRVVEEKSCSAMWREKVVPERGKQI